MNRVWTEAEKAIIRADSLARVPRPVTAAKLGRPVPATRTQALKLQAQIQVHRPWTDAEKDLLCDMMVRPAPLPTDAELAVALGRPETSLRPMLAELGLVGARRHRGDAPVTPEQAERRRQALLDRPRGTKTRDALAACAARKEERIRLCQAKAAEAERAKARDIARRDADALLRKAWDEAREAAHAERARLAAESRALALRPAVPKPVRAAVPQPRAVPAVVRPVARSAVPTAASRMALMRAAWNRVADDRIRPAADQDAVEARLMARLAGR